MRRFAQGCLLGIGEREEGVSAPIRNSQKVHIGLVVLPKGFRCQLWSCLRWSLHICNNRPIQIRLDKPTGSHTLPCCWRFIGKELERIVIRVPGRHRFRRDNKKPRLGLPPRCAVAAVASSGSWPER